MLKCGVVKLFLVVFCFWYLGFFGFVFCVLGLLWWRWLFVVVVLVICGSFCFGFVAFWLFWCVLVFFQLFLFVGCGILVFAEFGGRLFCFLSFVFVDGWSCQVIGIFSVFVVVLYLWHALFALPCDVVRSIFFSLLF